MTPTPSHCSVSSEAHSYHAELCSTLGRPTNILTNWCPIVHQYTKTFSKSKDLLTLTDVPLPSLMGGGYHHHHHMANFRVYMLQKRIVAMKVLSTRFAQANLLPGSHLPAKFQVPPPRLLRNERLTSMRLAAGAGEREEQQQGQQQQQQISMEEDLPKLTTW